ncbi:Golgi reassembly-stacking protein 2 isoform X2 [Hydra vulgaris]|uniref:Golgi reassembly-stacking protein 2 isoform X2 n=1 Tax=Hydra vulgaris TaxID=6087 RepID=A0ABM4C2M2_HYDVU
MGAGSSVDIPGGGTEGYHVLRVQEGSPGYKAGLEPFFDFIVSVENQRLDQDNETLKEALKRNVEKPVKILVYSSKTRKVRDASITPSNLWGGQGLLGVSIRFCSFEGAAENVWHILDVHPNSPADLAGLRPHTDYIIGSDTVLHDVDDFFSLVEQHENKALKLYIYNSETDGCREVTITPNSKWGGEGSIGCGIGYGYLHRIPIPDVTKSLHPPFIAPTTVSATGFSEVPLHISPLPINTSGVQESLGGINFSSTIPKTTSIMTPNLSSGVLNGYSAALTETQSPISHPHYATPNVFSTSQQVPLSNILSTTASNYQSATLIASNVGLNPPITNLNTITTNTYAVHNPNDVSRSPAAHPIIPPMEISQISSATIIAKPVPLTTDITLGATPSNIPAI